jgi:Carbohydrate binding domain (family 11)
MIDDMEEGSGSIIMQGGRSGSWFTYNDGTDGGTQTPTAGGSVLPSLIANGGRCTSKHAMNTFGAGFTGYGAGLGFDLNHPNSMTRMPYDMSPYTGIAFWALGPATGSQTVQVQVPEEATTPPAQGGTCMTGCNAHYFTTINFPSTGWVQVVIPFASLVQAGFGTQVAWDPKTVLSVQFVVDPAISFDFWVDDIGVY